MENLGAVLIRANNMAKLSDIIEHRESAKHENWAWFSREILRLFGPSQNKGRNVITNPDWCLIRAVNAWVENDTSRLAKMESMVTRITHDHLTMDLPIDELVELARFVRKYLLELGNVQES